MIDSLRGILGKGAGERALVEVNGVGYGVYISKGSKAKLPPEGSEIFFFTHTHVRENQFALYAFLTDLDRDIFTFLLKGNGVGPKLALSITSYYEGKELLGIIQSSEVRKLMEVPGVGKKKAEKLLLDLKDKFKDHFSALTEESLKKSFDSSSSRNWLKDLKIALRNLGYKDGDIQAAIRELEFLSSPPANLQEALRTTMRFFASNKTFIHRGKSHGTAVERN